MLYQVSEGPYRAHTYSYMSRDRTSFFSFCHTHKLAVDSTHTFAQGDTAPTRHRGQGAVQSFESSEQHGAELLDFF